MTVHIFQIGCRNFGRYGFEKILDKEEYLPVDVKLEAVCEKDFEHREKAENFSKSMGKNVDFYDSVDKIYEEAKKKQGTVLIYDAGPTQRHHKHIQRSLKNNFHHLTEKPPSVTREEHIEERKLASESKVNYKVDFIERENPAIKKMKETIEEDKVEKIKVFRESTFGLQRSLKPIEHAHLNEGCVLDKIINDIYIVDLANIEEMKIEKIRDTSFMPKNIDGEKVLQVNGATSRKIDENSSIAKVQAEFKSKDKEIFLSTSWLGTSEEAKIVSKKIKETFKNSLIKSEYKELNDNSFLDEETAFIVVEEKGRKLVGDLLNKKVYDVTHEKTIEVDVFPRDALYRVIEKAVLDAAGHDVTDVSQEELDVFMNGLFDIHEKAGEFDGEVLEALDKTSEKLESLFIPDKTDLNKNKLKGVAS